MLIGREKLSGHEYFDISSTIRAEYWIGRSYFCLKEHQLAPTFFQRALAGYEMRFGYENIETLNAALGAGLCHYSLTEHPRALEFLQRASAGREKVLGGEHSDTLETGYWLGQCHYAMANYQLALGALERVLVGYEKLDRENEYALKAARYIRVCHRHLQDSQHTNNQENGQPG